jgi:hypothetical protein
MGSHQGRHGHQWHDSPRFKAKVILTVCHAGSLAQQGRDTCSPPRELIRQEERNSPCFSPSLSHWAFQLSPAIWAEYFLFSTWNNFSRSLGNIKCTANKMCSSQEVSAPVYPGVPLLSRNPTLHSDVWHPFHGVNKPGTRNEEHGEPREENSGFNTCLFPPLQSAG